MRASSTSGVKKSVVATSARSASSRQTAASSPVSVPTSSSGACGGVSVVSTSASRPGASLQAHPAPWLNSVRTTGVGAAAAASPAEPTDRRTPRRRHASYLGVTLASDPRRRVPRTDAVLAEPRIALAVARLGRALVKDGRRRRAGARAPRRDRDPRPSSTPCSTRCPPPPPACARCSTPPACCCTPTSAGRRSPRPPAAALDVAAGTCDVELDLATGAPRPARGAAPSTRCSPRCPAAAAAHLVNNGAAALALVAHRAGRRRAGDRDRPRRAGGDRRRVPHPRPARAPPAPGCARSAPPTASRPPTTPTRSARTPRFVLKVHPSNFVVTGFTRSVGRRRELARASACRSSPTSAPGLLAPHPLLPDEPDAATALRPRRHAGHRVGRQAARRPAGRAAARRPRRGRRAGRPAAPAPAGPRAAGRQADAGRAGGDPARPGHARRGRPSTPTPAALTRPGAAARGDPAPRTGSTPRRSTRTATVGGGGAPGRDAAQRRGRAARTVRGRAARRRAGGARPARARPLPARPARAAVRRRRRAGRRRARGGRRTDAGRRHRRPRRPRQVDAGPGADRDGARPAGPRSAAAA